MFCYKVELLTTNAMRNSSCVKGKYISVEQGIVYAIAENIADVCENFPEAIRVEKVGFGVFCQKPATIS